MQVTKISNIRTSENGKSSIFITINDGIMKKVLLRDLREGDFFIMLHEDLIKAKLELTCTSDPYLDNGKWYVDVQ